MSLRYTNYMKTSGILLAIVGFVLGIPYLPLVGLVLIIVGSLIGEDDPI